MVTMNKVHQVQKDLGGIIPSQLKADQTAFVETEDFVYTINRVDDKFEVHSGNPLLVRDKTIISIVSVDRNTGTRMEDWVGFNMVLELHTPNGYVIITREVDSASIHGVSDTGKDYKIDLWEDFE